MYYTITPTRNPGGRKGFRLGRLTLYTLTASGLVAGGALAYANYDPVFKNQVDELVPGFARWADTAADLFVERTTGYPQPVPGSRHEESHRTSGWGGAGQGRLGDAGKKADDRKTDSNTAPAAKVASEPKPDHTDPNPETITNQQVYYCVLVSLFKTVNAQSRPQKLQRSRRKRCKRGRMWRLMWER